MIRTPIRALGISRRVFEKVGLFDEILCLLGRCRFLHAPEGKSDSDFFMLQPSLLHAVSASSGGECTLASTLIYCRSYMQFARKHFDSRPAVATMLRLVLLQRKLSRRNYGRIRLDTRSLQRGPATSFAAEAARLRSCAR
jgi:hypothetical protein